MTATNLRQRERSRRLAWKAMREFADQEVAQALRKEQQTDADRELAREAEIRRFQKPAARFRAWR